MVAVFALDREAASFVDVHVSIAGAVFGLDQVG